MRLKAKLITACFNVSRWRGTPHLGRVKRQGYGRASFELLRKRVLYG